MKLSKKLFSLFLALVIMIGAIPISVSSAEESVGTLPFGGVIADDCYNTDDNCTSEEGLSGSGTADEPYFINTRGDLKYFAQQVNSGNTKYNADGVYVKLTANIDLENAEWTPIGYKNPYLGNFDGDNHEVINAKISGSSATDAVSETNYVGFFGYIKDAEIKNFGIYQYTLDYNYIYNSTVGALVGYSESSEITDCYVNGSTNIAFDNMNPLERNDVIKYTPSAEADIPSNITADNSYGQGVILDMSNVPIFRGTTHIDVGGDVTALRIIGNPNALNTNFSITVKEHSKFDFYLELVDLIIIAPVNTDAIKVEGGRNIQIFSTFDQNDFNSVEGGNATSGGASAMAVNAPGSTVVLSGDTGISFYGGNGIDGADGAAGVNGGKGGDGVAGSNGNYAFKAKSIYIDNTVGVSLIGGHGGNGGNGGFGGKDISLDILNIDSSAEVKVIYSENGNGGVGGAGGKGGTGGTGGTGGNSTDNWLYGHRNGGNGGAGGAGGAGGNGGNGVTVGNAGSPGTGGTGGAKGCSHKSNGGTGATNKNTGVTAGSTNGYIKTTGETYFTSAEDNAETVDMYFSYAEITVGGFVGETDLNSVITRCASGITDWNIEPLFSENPVCQGKFAGKNSGKIECSIAAFDADGVYTLCDDSIGEQNGTVVDGEISLLSDSKDTQGVPYGVNDITYENTQQTRILRECTVEKAESQNLSGEIVIPDYVFEGRAISAVTKIVDAAFADCIAMSGIHLGSLVCEIGTGILAGCSSLEKITIGKSLKMIPEYTSGEQLFGLAKSGKLIGQYKLASYEVEDGNLYFNDIDGVLFATQYIEAFDKPVEICAIDAPACKEFSSDYILPELVVRIAPFAFAYSNIKSVELQYVREVGDYAFLNASLLETVRFAETDDDNNQKLQDYIDNNQVYYSQLIGTEAFANCTSLASVNLDSAFIQKIGDRAFLSCGDRISTITIGKGVKAIGENAFGSSDNSNYPTKFEAFDVHDDNAKYLSIDGVLYARLGDGSLKLLSYPILKSGENRDGVFYEGSFTIPQKDDDGNEVSVSVIENHAFHKSEKLYSAYIELTGLGEIGDYAFSNSQLREISIGAGINSIGDTNTDGETSVFSFCNNLESININDSNSYYTDIDGILFNKDITHLIRYPAGKSSNSYKVPDTVAEVWDNAFYGSRYLAFVTFSNRLTRLGSNPFDRSPSLIGIYFKDCYAPLSYGQDPFKTGNDSAVIYYTSGYYENNGAYLGWNIFETTYTISEYVPPFLQQGKPASYYTVAVMDQNGMPIDDVLVSLVDGHGNPDASHTVEGVRVFTDTYDEKYNVGFDIDFDTAYQLRVVDENGVYFGYENTEFYLDEATRITYITLSSVPTVSGISVSYRCKKPEDIAGDFWAGGQADTNLSFIQGAYYTVDINSEVAKVNTQIVDTFDIKVGCTSDSGSTITDYRLIQDNTVLFDYSGKAIVSGESGYNTLSFTLNTGDVKEEKDLIVEVTFIGTDGKQTVIGEKLNIQVLELELLALDLSWATNEIKLTVDKDIPVIGGAELSLSEFNKSKVNIAVGPDYFRVLIGDFGNDDIKLENEYFESNYDRHWGQIFTKDKNRRLWESNNVDKIGFTIGGYIEIKYKGLDANGEPDFDLNSSITGNLKYTYADGITRTVWVIPIRLEYKLELGAEATFELSYDFDTNSLYAPNLQFEVNGSLSAYAGIGCKLASAGVYGNITSKMLWDIAPQFELNKWNLKGDLGAYVKYNGLFLKFEKKWSLFEELKWNNEWTIYNKAWISDTTDGWGNQIAQTYAMAVAEYYDQENYVVATSEDSGDYSGIAPQLLQLDDTRILLVYADNFSTSSGYDDYNYQKLVYQVYNTETKEYTAPQIIDDIRDGEGNGYADGMFTLYGDQNGVYLAYTQMTSRLTAEDAEDVEGYVSALEVKTAVWDSGAAAFTDMSFVSSNDCYDMALTMGEVDGAPAVIWIQNGENDITGMTENSNMSILCSRYTGAEWETYTVAQNLPSITDIALYDGTIAYITDSNNDLLTVTAGSEDIEGYYDRKIITMDAYGTVLSTSAEEGAYHDVSVVGDGLVYYCSNNLYDLQTGTALFTEAVTNFPESYTVLTDAAGELCGILYTDNMTYDSESGESGSNLFSLFYDNGVWGKPIQLTDYGIGNYVSSFDAVSVDGELLLSALITQLSEAQNSGEEAELVTTNEFETSILSYPTGYSTEQPEFVYEDIAPDSDLLISVPVRNNGIDTLKADEIELSLSGVGSIAEILGIYDSEGNCLTNGLVSGGEGELRLIYHTDSIGSAEPIINVGEEAYTLELWYSDLAVSAKQVWLNGLPYLAASVYNLGLVSAKSNLSVSLEDNTFRTLETKQLSTGEMEHFLIPINPELLKGEAGMITLSLDVEGEYMVGNNTATVTFASDEDVPLGEMIYDVNRDGSVDVRDLIRLKKIMAGIEKETRESDINFDGELTAVDLGTFRKMLLTNLFDLTQIVNQ